MAEKFINRVFSTDQETTVSLTALRNQFYIAVEKAQDAVYQSLVDKKYICSNPRSTKLWYILIGICVIVFLAMPAWLFLGSLALKATLATGLIIAFFGFIMPARTKQGVGLRERILGLKLYLTVAEKQRLTFHNAPEKRPEHFEKLLPYAVALKVEKQWAEQFTAIYTTAPVWYNDTGWRNFNTMLLVGSLLSFQNNCYQTFVSSPASSGASSGGSGFSGGSSGGGFGGGGGGSW